MITRKPNIEAVRTFVYVTRLLEEVEEWGQRSGKAKSEGCSLTEVEFVQSTDSSAAFVV